MSFDSETDDLTLSDLPIELIQKILRFLDTRDLLSVARVSVKLRASALEDPTLWRSVQLNPEKDSLNYAQLLADHCPLLRSLSFSNKSYYKSREKTEAMMNLFRGCEHLEKLDLKLMPNNRMIDWVVSSFPNLKELNISEMRDLTVHSIGLLAKCKFLEKLDIGLFGCIGDSDVAAALKIIAENFPKLRALNIEGGPAECNEGFVHLLDQHKEGLRQLHVDGYILTDSTYKKLSECQILEELSIPQAVAMTDLGLASLLELRNLKKLVLGYTHKLTSQGLVTFFKYGDLSKLEFLSISCSELCDDGLTAIYNSCQNLRYLTLKECQNVSEEGIVGIYGHCRQLVSLTLDLTIFSMLTDDTKALPVLYCEV